MEYNVEKDLVRLMIEFWTKETIKTLKNEDIEQWFDVLNIGLVEDRGYDLMDPNIDQIKQKIKNDYIDYLKSCAYKDSFYRYYVYRLSNDKIVSLCRVVKNTNDYTLEGLQTHHDYYKQGYASKLVKGLLYTLKRDGIKTLNSQVRNHNINSIAFHRKMGFSTSYSNDFNTKFQLDIDSVLRKDLFDRWAETYNKSVISSEQNNAYPFAGYTDIQYSIIDFASDNHVTEVLDMGVGTGNTTTPLYHMGYNITGVDLSKKMLDIARTNMPKARLIQSDFFDSLNLLKFTYDLVVFNYSIHHLSFEQQVTLLEKISLVLNKNGSILIGDVATKTQDQMKQLSIKYEGVWDEEEYYPIYDIYQNSRLSSIYDIEFIQYNHVAGIFKFGKRHM